MENEDVIEKQQNDSRQNDKRILFMVLKKHKIGLLIILFLIMVSSTFAWFIYNKTVDMSLHAHVKEWNIQLGEESENMNPYEIKISALYPGMETIDTSIANGGGIPIVNNGELNADISLSIKSLTLFGEKQIAGEDYEFVKSADGKTFTLTGYPFELEFFLTSNQVVSGTTVTLHHSLEWDFDNSDDLDCTHDENGVPYEYNICDAQDTYFGEKSYEYSKASEGVSPLPYSLVIELNLNVTQTPGQ